MKPLLSPVPPWAWVPPGLQGRVLETGKNGILR
jgi:hypothetical protein